MAKRDTTDDTANDAAEKAAAEKAAAEKAAADKAAAEKAAADKDAAEKTITLADAQRMVDKAVKEAEKKAADAEAKAKLGETERLTKELEEVRAEVRMRDARDAISDALRSAGAKNPALLFAAVRDQLEFDDSGKLKDLASLVTDLTAEYPEQFGKEAPGGIDGGAGGGGGDAKLTLEAVKKMTPDEINKNWETVQAVMSGT